MNTLGVLSLKNNNDYPELSEEEFLKFIKSNDRKNFIKNEYVEYNDEYQCCYSVKGKSGYEHLFYQIEEQRFAVFALILSVVSISISLLILK